MLQQPAAAEPSRSVSGDSRCELTEAVRRAKLRTSRAWTQRDDCGGGIFWLAPDEERHPALCLRVSGDVADVHYFPRDRHPGFRCLGGNGLPKGGLTTLVYRGADPETGEQTPNEFVVPFDTARAIAKE